MSLKCHLNTDLRNRHKQHKAAAPHSASPWWRCGLSFFGWACLSDLSRGLRKGAGTESPLLKLRSSPESEHSGPSALGGRARGCGVWPGLGWCSAERLPGPEARGGSAWHRLCRATGAAPCSSGVPSAPWWAVALEPKTCCLTPVGSLLSWRQQWRPGGRPAPYSGAGGCEGQFFGQLCRDQASTLEAPVPTQQWLDHSGALLWNNGASAQGSAQSLALELVRMSPQKHKPRHEGPRDERTWAPTGQ